MNHLNLKKEKEDIKKKIEQGVFKTCGKSPTATASWWDTFARIQDDNGNIIPFVQCVKCSSILAYDSNRTGSSAQKAHAEACRGGGDASARRNQDIRTMLNKDNNVSAAEKSSFIEACAKYCSFDLRPFETVNGHGFEILCQSLLDLAHKNPHRIEAANIIPDPTTVSRRVKNLAERMLN